MSEPRAGIPIPPTSVAGKVLEEFAERQPVGALVDYATWDKVANLDVRGHRSILYGAFRRLARRTGAVWEAVPGVGYKRMDDSGKVGVAVRTKAKAVRGLKRTVFVLGTVEEPGALSDTDQGRYHGTLNGAALAAAVASSRSKKMLAPAPEEYTPKHALKAVLGTLSA